LFGERIRPVVVLIEYPELHGTTSNDVFSCRPRWYRRRLARRQAILQRS